jgi:hypothetical protein
VNNCLGRRLLGGPHEAAHGNQRGGCERTLADVRQAEALDAVDDGREHIQRARQVMLQGLLHVCALGIILGGDAFQGAGSMQRI